MQENKKALNPRFFLILLLGTLIISVPTRIYQLLNVIEPGTGFWKNDSPTIYFLYGIIAVFVLICLVYPNIKRKDLRTCVPSADKNIGVCITSFLLSASMAYDAVIKYGDFSDIYNGYDFYSDMTFRQYLVKSGGVAMALETLFAFISVIYFLLYGISALKGKSPSEYKLLAVSPILWGIFRIIYRFMRTISFLRVSELFFELCMIVFIIMFFMAFAQITAKVNGKGLEWKLFGYGVPTAFFCILCFLPRFVLTVMGKSDLLTDQSPAEYCDAAIAAFIIVNLISIVKNNSAKKSA
ncbi:MAG: hypothetical protein K6F09_02850 [Clostridiales bacterium]|nr:hypothetical protein [Clostridiales bacterium]